MNASTSTRRTFLRRAAAAAAVCSAADAPALLWSSTSTLAAAAPATAGDGPAVDAEGFVSLFDGKTLAGWHKNPAKIGHGTGGLWQVEDGAITGEQDPPASGNGGILLTDRTFGDFELRLELRPDWGPDSGLFLRSNEKGQCIQMMVDYHDRGNVGHLYGEGTGGWNTRPFNIDGVYDEARKLTALKTSPFPEHRPDMLAKTCTPEEFLQAWKVGDWNHVRVRCTGGIYPVVSTWINDLQVCEWDASTSAHPKYDKEKVAQTLGKAGHIAVQVHGGKGAWPAGAKCRWRNIRIKPLA